MFDRIPEETRHHHQKLNMLPLGGLEVDERLLPAMSSGWKPDRVHVLKGAIQLPQTDVGGEVSIRLQPVIFIVDANPAQGITVVNAQPDNADAQEYEDSLNGDFDDLISRASPSLTQAPSGPSRFMMKLPDEAEARPRSVKKVASGPSPSNTDLGYADAIRRAIQSGQSFYEHDPWKHVPSQTQVGYYLAHGLSSFLGATAPNYQVILNEVVWPAEDGLDSSALLQPYAEGLRNFSRSADAVPVNATPLSAPVSALSEPQL